MVVAAWILLKFHEQRFVLDSRVYLFEEESWANSWVETELTYFCGSRVWPAGVCFLGKVVVVDHAADCKSRTAYLDEAGKVTWMKSSSST